MFPLKDNIPTRRFPVVTVVIIALNVIVYLFVQKKTGIDFSGDSLDPRALTQYAAIPYEVTNPGKECEFAGQQIICEGQPGVSGSAENTLPTWATIFTSMFSHAGLLHLGGNMLFLWIFGNNIEDSMGRPRFIVFYLLGGLAALLAQTVIDPNAAVPTIGASGAVAAVLGGYALLYPRARVVTVIFIIIFFTIVTLPALLVLGAWFVLQLLNGAGSLAQPVGEGGGVAYFAHIGGFVFGLLMIRLFADRIHEDYESAHRTPVY